MEQERSFLLSKGHGCLGLYVVLEDLGFLDEMDLSNFCSYESNFGGHPESSTVPVIEFSTGSLGHGMPVAVGLAVAAKLKRKAGVFCCCWRWRTQRGFKLGSSGTCL